MKLQELKLAVSSAVNSAKNASTKVYASVGGAVITTVATTQAHAANQLPVGIFANMLADLTDTFTAINLELGPVAVASAILGSVLIWIKRGSKTAVR